MTAHAFVARVVTAAGAAALLVGVAGPAAAHSPNPLLGSTTWGQDEVIPYTWQSGMTPPSWLVFAIDAGAGDIGESRKSRAALFERQSGAASKIAYGIAVPCSSYGIACMDRSGIPDSFGMWFRPHGYPFDWGTLRWCQAQSTFTNGCYDAENVALDEFGHVEILGHHVNYDDESDFTDSVVQFAARSRPKEGWNQHALGRCDVARLQLEYDLSSSSSAVSTCLDMATSLSIAATGTDIPQGTSTTISGTLKIGSSSSARKLAGDPLSGRTVVLQRRVPGFATWTTIATMSAGSGAGTYSLSITPSTTYEYRLSFTAPSTEGLNSSTSSVLTISTYVPCRFGTTRVACV